jgi:hypothetical protein
MDPLKAWTPQEDERLRSMIVRADGGQKSRSNCIAPSTLFVGELVCCAYPSSG